MTPMFPAVCILMALTAGSVFAQSSPAQVTRKEIPGIRNYSRVDATVGCGGATDASAFPALENEGFASVVNLRMATEPGVDVPGSTAAAQKAGLKYFHVPLNSSEPDPAVV